MNSPYARFWLAPRSRIRCGEQRLFRTLQSRLLFSSRPKSRAVPKITARSVFGTILLMSWCLGCQVEAAPDPEALVNQGQSAFETGKFSQAALNWEKALDAYRHQGNTNAQITTSLALAGATQALGQHKHAVELLQNALDLAQSSGNPSRVTLVKSKLGAALVMTQETQRAAPLLREALAAARSSGDPGLSAAILNDLGNLLASEQKYLDAIKAYEESATLGEQTGNLLQTAEALCNAGSCDARSGETNHAEALNSQALKATERLKDSHAKAFLLLTEGQTDRKVTSEDPEQRNRLLLRAHKSFQQALEIGQHLEDQPIQTYALGFLAQLYETDGQSDAALALSRRAVFAAQEARMPEALYRWEWQSARLLKKLGDVESAIAAYRRAAQTLQPIRNDVSIGYGNSPDRLSFRESQGPLFYELADLLLLQSKSAKDPKQEQELLREARDTVESLKAVELEDYFCDECVDVQRVKTRVVENVDKNSAVIYLIPLPDRTEVLLGESSGLKRFTAKVAASELTEQVRQFRRNLETRTTYGYLEQAQSLYDLLIRPMRGVLEADHITTLVFVSDGALRTIPLAALHDGQRFLIQDFAVAVVPGLSLVEPKTLQRRNARLLLNGLSKPVQGFSKLDFVTNELENIDQNYSSETLLNEQFTSEELQRKMQEQFSIVHIASHGQFDRDVHKTFVLTYDNKLTLDDLELLIRPSQYRGRPVEMLVLSACQTAAGDDRAALGLAGIAIKAGARSALASLWFVNDQSTSALITEFYTQLRVPSISKAQALQAAQIKLLHDRRYRHPCYWSPYLIIGNWL